jgi:hypothetical protein
MCDCEYQDCEATCGHHAGGCTNLPTVKVSMFGLRANLCSRCLEATCNNDIFPLNHKLKHEYYVTFITPEQHPPTEYELDWLELGSAEAEL